MFHDTDYYRAELDSLFRALRPHLSRAADLHRQWGRLEAANAARSETMDNFRSGIVAVRPDRRVVYANRAAETLLTRSDVFYVSGGRFRLRQSFPDLELGKLIQSAFSGAAGAFRSRGGIMRVDSAANQQGYVLVISPPVPRSISGCVTIFINDRSESIVPATEILRRLYGFTAAEARLASLLAQGESLPEIGDRLQLSQSTLRTQLQHIFGKTETNRQGELIQRLLSDLSIR